MRTRISKGMIMTEIADQIQKYTIGAIFDGVSLGCEDDAP